MDLVVAMFAKATGLSTRDLTVRFVPRCFSPFDAKCFLFFQKLAWFRLFRRSGRIPRIFWRRFVFYSGIAPGRRR